MICIDYIVTCYRTLLVFFWSHVVHRFFQVNVVLGTRWSRRCRLFCERIRPNNYHFSIWSPFIWQMQVISERVRWYNHCRKNAELQGLRLGLNFLHVPFFNFWIFECPYSRNRPTLHRMEIAWPKTQNANTKSDRKWIQNDAHEMTFLRSPFS